MNRAYVGFAVAFLMLSVTPILAADFVVGVCTHIGRSGYDQDAFLARLQALDATSFRTAMPWKRVERRKGSYSIPKDLLVADGAIKHASAKGIRPLVILDYGNSLYEEGGLVTTKSARNGFVNYADWVVRRYKGSVKYYEVWNEWYLGAGSTARPRKVAPVSDYVKLLKQVYARIKEIDPEAVVLAGGAGDHDTSWYIDFARQGGMQYTDGLSVHPYVSGAGLGKNTPEASLSWVDDVYRTLTKMTGKDINIYITEIGWPTHNKGYTPEVVATYLSRFVLMASATPYIKGLWWYDLEDDGDDGTNREHRFGLEDRQHLPRPAFGAFRFVTAFLRDGHNLGIKRRSGWVELATRRPGTASSLVVWRPTSIPGHRAQLVRYLGDMSQRTARLAARGFLAVDSADEARAIGENSPVPVIFRADTQNQNDK